MANAQRNSRSDLTIGVEYLPDLRRMFRALMVALEIPTEEIDLVLQEVREPIEELSSERDAA